MPRAAGAAPSGSMTNALSAYMKLRRNLMLNTLKATLIALPLAVTALAAPTVAKADLACDTIRMVVPWKAGGGTDRIGRGLASALEKASGKSVIVDNISGASSATGTIQAMKADPDGCTILMNGTTEILAFMTFSDELPITIDDMAFV